MRVAIDARTLQEEQPGGVGRGLASLLPHLADSADIVLLTDARRPPVVTELPQVALRGPLTARSWAWLQLAAPRWLAGWDGIFHCPYNGLPFRQPVPMVVTIHDLTFETHPEFFGGARRNRLAFRVQARHAARSAHAILTVAPEIRDQIVATYDVDPARTLVAPNAVDPAITAVPEAEARQRRARLDVPARYVVALGGAERRGLATAIDAWQRSGAPVGLVAVAGGESTGATCTLPWLTTPDWAAVLGGADALLYASRYESFGMPALEAAALGVPTICARVGALPRTLGDAAMWVDQPTAEALGDGLARLVDDDHLRASLSRRCRTHAAAWPTWATVAGTVLEAWRMAGRAGAAHG